MDLVDCAVEHELDVLAEGKPLGGLGFLGQEGEVSVAVEFHAGALGLVGLGLLHLGIDPELRVLAEVFARDTVYDTEPEPLFFLKPT